MSLILLWSYIYLFAFCVIQSSLCEMALLLFKINQMLQSKSILGTFCDSLVPDNTFFFLCVVQQN